MEATCAQECQTLCDILQVWLCALGASTALEDVTPILTRVRLAMSFPETRTASQGLLAPNTAESVRFLMAKQSAHKYVRLFVTSCKSSAPHCVQVQRSKKPPSISTRVRLVRSMPEPPNASQGALPSNTEESLQTCMAQWRSNVADWVPGAWTATHANLRETGCVEY